MFATRLALIVAILLGLSAPVRAQPADLFSVAGIAVDANADSAAAARAQALAEGQRRAARQMLEKLTLRGDHGRLPPLGDALVNGMVRGFELADERTSATRYLARMTVRFHPEAVRRTLREAAIPYSETRARPALVLPLLEAQGATLLWDDPNPWREAWSRREPRDGLVPLLVPRGDLADAGAIGAEQAVNGDAAAVARIAQRYGATDALVARAVPQGGGLRVELARYGAGGRSMADSFTVASGDFGAAVREAELRLEESWKRAHLLRLDSGGTLSVTVPLRSLADWVAVRERLGQAPEVRRFELAALSHRDAQVLLQHFGDPGQLAAALAQRNLALANRDGFWTLSLADRGRASAPPQR